MLALGCLNTPMCLHLLGVMEIQVSNKIGAKILYTSGR